MAASRRAVHPIVTHGIGALASVAVAFIGILPQLRQKDERIDQLAAELARVQQASGAEPVASRTTWSISGSVKAAPGAAAAARYEVYLVRDVPPVKWAHTGDDGKFQWDGVPPDSYNIIVRDFGAGCDRTVRALITRHDRDGRIESQQGVLEYRLDAASPHAEGPAGGSERRVGDAGPRGGRP